MGELLVGGLFGLVVAVVTQWMARGGRLKAARATIREELELLRLLEAADDDQLRAKLKLQARVHLIEYLEEPSLDENARRLWLVVFVALNSVWTLIGAAVLVVASDPISTRLPAEAGWQSLLLGIASGVLIGVLMLLPSNWLAKQIVRRRFSARLRAGVAQQHSVRRSADRGE